ncbi:protein phosphatase 2 regulatory subunit A, alpha isoform, putative [Ichthyophthirius multifiliis]|uniref:Protein phosphatase 2 regulatory subunit A, alpha isoform, putative n=1 Tax=Ichthyophthirius multifiliis TaxID=5932 RepID=G0QL58_ICHMU|nr:protein phosphatase 2 regulatory subunit A, alpha isoform, putative [Ichthyophthirius multifiliis]EGR34046.1 protein phosphatase 2 regulatory subunit A, alpha isoform, putative [Ichthyophthirius multifiliis]|eukprot:XP_004039350.1 protein phosphatase 2 regulatory subunit A, alpha isoform, putative [Ichthyophthirius multifiliis]
MSDSNPFELLKEEMESDEISVRVNAIHRLKIVATLMGADQIKSILIPYIESLIKKEEDEVLFAIAQQFENLSQLLQGNQTILLPNLEMLASSEETVVREQAVKSMINIANSFNDNEVQNLYIPLIIRLAINDQNFTCRVSSVHLMCTIYPRAGAYKDKIRTKFIELCSEETPMVRRVVAQKIGEFSTVIEKEYVLSSLIQSVKQLISDEQDLVRVLVLNSLKLIAKVLKKDENKQHTLPIIIAATEDKSWRVRLSLSKIFPEIAEAFGEEGDSVSLIQIFTNLLRDTENDVRSASIQSLTKFLKILSPEKLVIIIPHLQYLAKDSVFQVRAGVTEVVYLMINILPKDTIVQKLLPLIIELFDDESKEVRQGATKAVSKYVEVIGVDALKTAIPLFKKTIEDNKWRVRVETYDALANIAKSIKNQEVFVNNIESIYFSYLKDRVAAVRENAAEKLQIVIQIYKEWATSRLFKFLQEGLNKDNNYLYRQSVLQSLKVKLYIIYMQVYLYKQKILGLNCNLDFVNNHLLPVIIKQCGDNCPNIKFVCVKVLKEIAKRKEIQQGDIRSALNGMCNDNDKDVKYFAQEALQDI